MPQIITGSEPFLFPGGRTGCILLLGFTSILMSDNRQIAFKAISDFIKNEST